MIRRFVDGAAAIAGVLLRAVFAAIAVVRRPRPIHPRGILLEGSLEWTGSDAASGIRWIDEVPEAPVPVTARVSRSVGLPGWSPDVIGLAIRVPTAEGWADVEFASTGSGVPGRFILMPRVAATRGFFGTLLPYRSSRGPVLLGARGERGARRPADLPGLARSLRTTPWRVQFVFAGPTGTWHPFAEASLRTAAEQDDAHLRFDAVRRLLPGAGTYRWVRLARQPSYRHVQPDERPGRVPE
ncbi:hypothetical protein [Microbacterium sp.]|uniref:hypothetical protein n=1 Tax=Microbacterium sp. TaxID=51671 RepID=UPI002811B64B|nr:hypothetical protein [Microbacterium sp.]